MIKISHECPIYLLDYLKDTNDYLYTLPHLLDQNKEYRNFFIRCKDEGKEIYMDNSVHELSYPYDSKRLLYWINELKPTNFFIPDELENKTQTIINAKKWSKIELPDGVMKVAVIQGKSLGDAIECVQIFKDLGYKKIAIPYGSSYYNEIFPHPNKDFGKSMGRLMVVSKLHEIKLLTDLTPIHLLGSSWAYEFKFFKDFKSIESIDTSAPIMTGLEGEHYGFTNTINKPKLNLNETQNWGEDKISEYKKYLIKHNIKMFKEINQL